MHPLVRDLYKRFIIVGKEYPTGYQSIREKIREGFLKNSNITDEIELKKAVAYGRYWVREVKAISHFSKFRAMKHRYDARDH